jgi:prephenate dehydrogenase
MPFKVLVVGGAGSMGRWCASIFNDAGFDVCISSRQDVSELARSMSVCVARPEEAGEFDIVVLSVPMDAIEKVASEIGPRMRRGSLLMDLSSLKKAPVEAMLKYAPASSEVIGAHPLFGPGAGGKGRTVVLVPTERSARWLPILTDVLADAGLQVATATAEEHDRRMAVAQALTHFMYVSWGRAMERLSVDIKAMDEFGTPVYEITKELAGRVLSNDPELYALIQSSPEAGVVRRAYVEACADLSAFLDVGERERFVEAFKATARYYGDIEGAKKRSDHLMRKAMEDRLFVRDSVGTERAFEIECEPHEIYGIVREANRDDFMLETPGGVLTLRYEEMTPMGDEALQALKARTQPAIRRDILVKMPIGADPAVLKWALTRIGGVVGVEHETRDALGPDYVIYKFAIDVQADRSEETLHRILTTIWGLGLEVK